MIGQDRLELNERFKIAYKALETKGIIKKNHPTKSKSAFAAVLLGSKQYGHIISKFIKGKRHIDYKHARILCHEFGVSEAFMFDGIGTPFSFFAAKPAQKQTEPQPNLEVSVFGNILFTNVKAFAGTAIDAESPSADSEIRFSLPGVRGDNLYSFTIEGNSMEPILNNGDIVVCRALESVNDIKENEIYAIKNNGSVWVKYVQPIYNRLGNRNHIQTLKLISANYLEHDPFMEEVNPFTRLFKVIRRISAF